jgi:UDP-sulfoquinovose synthase
MRRGEYGTAGEGAAYDNPREEMEEHYYNPAHHGLLELGLEPHFMTDDVVAAMIEAILPYRDRIAVDRILPRVRWRQ